MIKISNLRLYLFFCLFIVSNYSCKEVISDSCEDNIKVADKYQINTFKNEENSWGYNILKEGKILIHQPNIPAIDGIIHFTTQEDAKSAATLVVDKLNKNIFPPSLSIDELESIIKKN